MNLSPVEREEVATELKRFAADLNLTEDQKEKLSAALTEAREKIKEYLQQNPNTTKADVISKVVANRDAIRQRDTSSERHRCAVGHAGHVDARGIGRVRLFQMIDYRGEKPDVVDFWCQAAAPRPVVP